MEIRPILSALLRSKTGPILVALQVGQDGADFHGVLLRDLIGISVGWPA